MDLQALLLTGLGGVAFLGFLFFFFSGKRTRN